MGQDAWKITLGGLTDRVTRRERSSISWLTKVQESFNHLYNLELSQKSKEDNAMAQQMHVSIGQRFATPLPKNHKTRRWAKRRRTQMFINGHTKRSAKLGISSEKQDSVTMQNAVNHINYENRYFQVS